MLMLAALVGSFGKKVPVSPATTTAFPASCVTAVFHTLVPPRRCTSSTKTAETRRCHKVKSLRPKTLSLRMRCAVRNWVDTTTSCLHASGAPRPLAMWRCSKTPCSQTCRVQTSSTRLASVSTKKMSPGRRRTAHLGSNFMRRKAPRAMSVLPEPGRRKHTDRRLLSSSSTASCPPPGSEPASAVAWDRRRAGRCWRRPEDRGVERSAA